jgi:hypothetical protein
MVNVLVNLQDPIPKAPENPATPVDASVGLQGLEEPIVAASDVRPSLQEAIVTLSAISPPPERTRLQEPIVTSSAVTPPPERVRSQEPIITSLAVTPPPERVCLSEFYRLPTEGYTQGGKFWVGRRRDQELEGARNTKLRQVRATRRVIPYVLYGGLYCVRCRLI